MQVCYPRCTDKPLYHGLVTQCASLRLPFLEAEEVLRADLDDYAVVVDALFGFSFRGPPRPPFAGILTKLAAAKSAMVASVDIPSGAAPVRRDSVRRAVTCGVGIRAGPRPPAPGPRRTAHRTG